VICSLHFLTHIFDNQTAQQKLKRHNQNSQIETYYTYLCLQNGKYLVSPDPRRGTLSLVWTPNPSSGGNSSSNNGGTLKLEWKDRRTRTVVDTLNIFPEDDCTYSRVDTGRESDRVYLLQYGNASDRRFFYWLQEKEDKDDEDNCVKMNVLMSDAEECAKAAGEEGGASSGGGGSGGNASGSGGDAAPAGDGARSGAGGMDVSNLGGGALDNQALMQIMQGLGTGSSGSGGGAGAAAAGGSSGAGSATPSTGQVDALSSILENLGMPQNQQGGSGDNAAATVATPGNAATSASTPAAPSRSGAEGAAATPASSGGLTLADLQGAMAGLSTATPAASMGVAAAGPPLSELATSESIAESGILDDEEVKAKLIALLPEGQKNEAMLRETLRSPQVVQCLKSLTAALVSDDGSLDGLNSVLANFDLKAEDGAASIARGNTIQAFLDCVLKSVEREKEAKNKESGGAEESKE